MAQMAPVARCPEHVSAAQTTRAAGWSPDQVSFATATSVSCTCSAGAVTHCCSSALNRSLPSRCRSVPVELQCRLPSRGTSTIRQQRAKVQQGNFSSHRDGCPSGRHAVTPPRAWCALARVLVATIVNFVIGLSVLKVAPRCGAPGRLSSTRRVKLDVPFFLAQSVCLVKPRSPRLALAGAVVLSGTVLCVSVVRVEPYSLMCWWAEHRQAWEAALGSHLCRIIMCPRHRDGFAVRRHAIVLPAAFLCPA